MAAPRPAFRTGTTALVRAVARPTLPCPPLPDLNDHSPNGSATCVAWLREIWANGDLAEALEHASPVLAAQVGTVCTADEPSTRDVRRAALSVARYLLRSQHRATPFGLFAGVTVAEFGPRAGARWGVEHVAVGHAGAEWLAAVVERLESCPDLLERLPVVVNNTVTSRGDRLIVPFQSDAQDDRTRPVEASLALTEPVRAVRAATRAPIRFGALAGKLQAEFPEAGPEKVHRLLAELIQRRVLITSLHAPSTETDALGYLLDQLEAIDADTLPPVAEIVRELRAIRTGLEECTSPGGRDGVAAQMRAFVPGLRRHPVALDLRLDAQLVLPYVVAREIERAALILTRVSARPYGTAVWGAYHQRFYERYGIGTMVPLRKSSRTAALATPTATQAPRPAPVDLGSQLGMTPSYGWRRPPRSTAATRWSSPTS